MVEGFVGEGDATVGPECSGEASLGVGQRSFDDGADILVGQRLQAPDTHPREQSRVHFEVWVLRRGSDQRDRAVLDVRQEGVLLGLVEAMDLVEEQDGALLVESEAILRLGNRRPNLHDARHDGRHRREVGADLGCEQARETGLARPGRSPEHDRGEVAARDAAAERSALTDEVLLADELVERARTHAGGEWLLLGRRLEEWLGSSATGLRPYGRHVAKSTRGVRSA